jgi:diguanylate cyclase (GGDEF)-like protein/PAS domain S-box-containing protein
MAPQGRTVRIMVASRLAAAVLGAAAAGALAFLGLALRAPVHLAGRGLGGLPRPAVLPPLALIALLASIALICALGAIAAALAARALGAAARESRELCEAIHDGEERFRTLADVAVDAVVTFDSRGTVTFANPAAGRLLGYPEAELVGLDSAMLLPEFLRRVHRDELARYLATGVRLMSWQAARLLALDRRGKEVPVEVTFIESRRGEEPLFTAVARHLGSRRLAEQRLREDRKRFEVLSEISRIAFEDLEYRPMLQRICDTLARAFGWEFVAFISIVADRGCFVCEALTTTCPTSIHVGYQRELGSGVVGQVAATGKPILLDDVGDFPTYVETLPGARSELCVPVSHKGCDLAVLNLESTRVAAFHHQLPFLTKVAEQVAGALASARLYEEVRQRATLALVDALTGVANRRQFDAELEREWRRGIRSGAPLSLLLLDVDGFKAFNDRYGHPAGDDCLRQVAAALADVPRRAADLVARYGGEEFAMVLPEIDPAGAESIAEAARATVEALAIPHAASAAAPVVTISAGAATRWPVRGGSAMALVAAADHALYLAKRQGRNRVQVAPAPPTADHPHDRPQQGTRLRSVGRPASS